MELSKSQYEWCQKFLLNALKSTVSVNVCVFWSTMMDTWRCSTDCTSVVSTKITIPLRHFSMTEWYLTWQSTVGMKNYLIDSRTKEFVLFSSRLTSIYNFFLFVFMMWLHWIKYFSKYKLYRSFPLSLTHTSVQLGIWRLLLEECHFSRFVCYYSDILSFVTSLVAQWHFLLISFPHMTF